jgi:hypothetical protein
VPDPRDFLPPPPWEGPPVPRVVTEDEKEQFTVLDSKDRPHSLESKMIGFIPTSRWFLDGKLILADDQYGWIYPNPYGNPKPVRDKILRDNIDMVVFGSIMPTGTEEEEE